MVCKKCLNLLPEGAAVCPVCGTEPRGKKSKGSDAVKFFTLFSDILVLVMSLLNAFILATSSHYVTYYENNLWYARQVMQERYPSLKVTDILFLTLLCAFPILSVIARHYMKKRQRNGLLLMTVTHICVLLWTVLYPVITCSITYLRSPVLSFVIIQATLFALLSAVSLIYLFRSSHLI